MLPQVLLKSGISAYVFMRPTPQEKGLPARLFWWEAPDGSRVLAYRIPFEYNTAAGDIERSIRRCAGELKPPLAALMCFYGVGNHGGGPTRANIESILRLQHDPGLPTLLFSSPDQYFSELRAQDLSLPVVHDELQHVASGCYAAHSGVKRWNRRAENLLAAAEKWAMMAWLQTGLPYPAAELAHAWQNVLFNQFHDILPGTCLEAACDDARDSYGEANAIAGRALNAAVQRLAWNVAIQPEPGLRAIVVFNPHAWASRACVDLEFSRLGDDDILLDDACREAPMQLLQSAALIRSRSRFCFMADLPPLGYATYRVVPLPAALPPASAAPAGASDTVLENARFRLQFDPDSGCLVSLRDKQLELEVLAGPAAQALVMDDPSDTWSHDVYRFDRLAGVFTPLSVRRVADGPVLSTIRVVAAYGQSRLTQDFTQYADLDRIDVRVTLDWREQSKLLKLRFPLNLHYHNVTYEIPYGHLERGATGLEEPLQSWVDLSGASRNTGAPYGLALLNDGKHSCDVNVRDVGLTVLRSPIYAHHHPAQPRPGRQYSYQDQGLQRFVYSLLPHAGSWEQAGVVRAAAEINQPPIVVPAAAQSGALPQRDSFVSVEPANILVSAIKQAEDGAALVLRAYETSGTATTARITLPQLARRLTATFAPSEIKTFLIPYDPQQPIVETNLLELLA